MEISIESYEPLFTEHLNKKNNSRILFSGKFGTGKSHFLNKYFDNKKENVNLFWLSPVNYTVGANNDIFEWIKIDIAKQLASKYLNIAEYGENEKEYTDSFLVQAYINQNTAKIISGLIGVLAKTTVKLKTGIDVPNKFYNDFEKFKLFVNDEVKNEKQQLYRFVDDALQIKGSIFEDDIITRTIRTSITIIKENSRKENILVIDDLDRLDPEHIFRILNILSAHNDHFEGNKFGFDKIILVCDYENIEKIYKHKYGTEIDFTGYIEKFFTYEPFKFSINNLIIEYCDNHYLKNILNDASRNLMALLLIEFFNQDLLKIRNLKKIAYPQDLICSVKPPIYVYITNIGQYRQIDPPFIKTEKIEIDYGNFDFIKVVYLLSLAFNGVKQLKEGLNKIRLMNNNFSPQLFDDVLKSIGILSHISKNILTDPSVTFYEYNGYRNGLLKIEYPKAFFFSFHPIISIKWNLGTPYAGGDYFADGRMHDNFVDQQERNNLCKFALLVDEIIPIIDFIIKSNLLVFKA